MTDSEAVPVSYTHLDVYKRQSLRRVQAKDPYRVQVKPPAKPVVMIVRLSKRLSLIHILTDLGIDVLLVNPENQELSDEMRDIVSVAMNCQDKAEELSAFVAAQEEFLSKATENSEKPTVYLAGNSSFLSTAGSQMYQNSLITMAGGENVAAEISDTYWAEVSYEQVLAWNPDYIIIAAEADYTVDDVLNDPNIADLQAVKDKKVYQMPNSAEAWDSPCLLYTSFHLNLNF